MSQITDEELRLTKDETEKILAFRRDMHMHPELSHEEFETTRKIREFLASLPGVEFLELPDTSKVKTGVVARIRGALPGPETGLRADIDALPVQEPDGLAWKSQCDGKMHACGHDTHTSALLGAAMILSRLRDRLPGTVDLLFQEAEETTKGCREMLDAGLFSVIHPSHFFGMHNRPEVPEGQVVIQTGGLMSAKSNFIIRIKGKGGHGAMPDLCIDPIVCAGAVVMSLQTIVSRNIAPTDSAILTIGAIHGGTVENLIADSVEMKGCVRALSTEAKELEVRRLEKIVRSTAEAYQCQAEIEYRETIPLVYNSPEMTALAGRAATRIVGKENCVTATPTVASEDFSQIMELVPSYFYWIGSAIPGRPFYAWHNPHFQASDKAVTVGAEVLASSAVTTAEEFSSAE